jgi:hypothetical protein
MIDVLDAAGPLEGESAARVMHALSRRAPPAAFDPVVAEGQLADLLRGVEPTYHAERIA